MCWAGMAGTLVRGSQCSQCRGCRCPGSSGKKKAATWAGLKVTILINTCNNNNNNNNKIKIILLLLLLLLVVT